MKLKFIIISAIQLFFHTLVYSQAAWTFVGPVSNNNLNGAEFETSQMNRVLTNPNAPNWVFATSKFGGLWVSSDNGSNWQNVDISSSGQDQALAIANKNNQEILIGTYRDGEVLTPHLHMSFSYRVSKYNFVTNTLSHYPPLPVNSKRVIKCIAVHPLNEDIIYAGTTQGLYRFNGTEWQPVVQGKYIESILFKDNQTCYIAGSDVASSEIDRYPVGNAYLAISIDANNVIFNDVSTAVFTNSNNYLNSKSIATISKIGNNILVMTHVVPNDANLWEYRYFYKINNNGLNITGLIQFSDTNNDRNTGFDRLTCAYDAINNAIWFGDVYLKCAKEFAPNTAVWTVFNKYTNTKMLNCLVHNDIHSVHINGNTIWVACDGGIAKANLNEFNNNNKTLCFSRMNNGLNVSLLNSFSGSQRNPRLYLMGGQDITNNDIYNDSIGRNIKTITGNGTNENDAGIIYGYNDSVMVMFHNQGSTTKYTKDQGTTVSNAQGVFFPEQNAPFRPSSSEWSGYSNYQVQKIVQDPFRPERIYQLGSWNWGTSILAQFSLSHNKMIYKVGFEMPQFPQITSNGVRINDMSFSKSSKNSVHFITTNYAYESNGGNSNVIKYIGPDFDDCWKGHNEFMYGSQNQWQDITPDLLNFSSIGGGAVNITADKLNRVLFKKIETSVKNKNELYVATRIDYDVTNPNTCVKVLKYHNGVWFNYSEGLPCDAMVCTMVLDHYSNDGLYLSTDWGIYYRDASMNQWEEYSYGAPKIRVTQMEINYNENTIRIGTYGRGIWKSPLKCPSEQNIVLNYPVNPGVYEAENISFSTYVIPQTKPMLLRATNSIILSPGTNLTPQNDVHHLAVIHGCNYKGSSPYLFRATDPNVELGEQEKENLQETIKLFPNPTNNNFNIVLPEGELVDLKVFNVSGKLIIEKKGVKNNIEVSLEGYSKGIYFVKLNGVKLSHSEKLILE